ncbi:phospholipase A2 inhibitor and Ly6/PLAUR domain-containing protein-like [Mauremys mutica]|uniref:phospholipase A2 inhibitor and Ly6/PLAUR domain-containing protein-like n=1 Tax=Mauremys mutica TaxID=74926 RepID=UPI001D1610CE|nr:phospholipase A2 inhibitor and Ly6/PLAUR domain-containing protein-like [Mauremys mutica]
MADSGVRMELVGKTSERKTRRHVPRLTRGEQGLEPTRGAWPVAAGSALQCEVCQSKAGSCSGPLQPCAPSEGTCVAAVAEFNLEENSFSYAAKSCLEPESCEPGPFTVTSTRNNTVRVNIACCNTDGCNAGAIPVPTVSSVPNGRQCPSCFAMGADRCQDMEPLACTGAEDHCIDIAGTLTLGNETLTRAATGCGSPGACGMRVGVKKYAQGVVDVLSRAECDPAPWAGGDL